MCYANNEKRKTTYDRRNSTIKSRKISERLEETKLTKSWEYWKEIKHAKMKEKKEKKNTSGE